MPVSRIDLLEYVKSKEITPLCDSFRQCCHEWLLQKFDLTENTLIDGKTVQKWLDYITEETVKRWRAAKRVWKPLFGPTKLGNFFRIEVKVSTLATSVTDDDLDANLDTAHTDEGMDVDEPPVDLSELSVFQYFNCPKCDFKSRDRTLFKTHVIKNHDYVKGELHYFPFYRLH